ncbi:MAG: hypothetical protein M3Z11_10615 [Candidatus Dormibacteraeota bacterium]|nr:hypothetical protein [Candidatus Dormibacteraeota bacterium]
MRGGVIACLSACVVLAACGATAQSPRDQSVKLALSLPAGATYRYTVHTSGSLKSTQPGMAMTVQMDITMRQTYQVVSADSAHVATVRITIDQISSKIGQTSLPIPASLPDFTAKIGPDGATVAPSADPLSSLAAGLPFAGPGPMGGVFPMLPNKNVKPGDRWTSETKLPMPAGVGAGTVTWQNQLLRFDTIHGLRVAVIEGHFTAPMDSTMDAGTLAQGAFGSGTSPVVPTPPPGLSPPPGFTPPPDLSPPPGFSPAPGASTFSFPPGFNPSVSLQGTTSGTMTSWVDPSTGRLVKASGTSSSNVTESLKGLPSPDPAMPSLGLGTGPSQMSETQAIDIAGQ